MEHIYSLYNTADVLYRVLRSNNLAEQIMVNSVVPMEPKIYSIVLVDDSPAILTLAGWLLREEGYEVHTFTRALAAFEFIAQHPVHLVISDLKMPSMDGLAFAQALREPCPTP